MLSSVTYEARFDVRANTEGKEIVCLTGSCRELGNWDPLKAVKLTRQTKRQLSTSDEGPEQGDVWAKRVKFSGMNSVSYRYFVGLVLNTDAEEENVIVTRWETNVKPRVFSVQDCIGKTEDAKDNVQVFGEYGDHKIISRGWLIDQTQINLHLHHNPISMWNTKSRNQTYSIKCTPLDHRYRDEHEDDDTYPLPAAANTLVTAAVLEKGVSVPQSQSEFGLIYTPNSYLTFMVQTLEPESTGFQLDFYQHPDPGTDSYPRHVGYSFILPLDGEKSMDTKTVPISSLKHRPLGQIKFEHLIVKPFAGKQFDMSVSYQNYWKKTRRPLEIGHRGMGVSFAESPKHELTSIPENSVQSLVDAASHGADYVEMDVHLTKDKEVIIYHDFKVKITYKKKRQGELELLEIPVKDLKLSELQSMKLWHTAKPENMDVIHKEDLDPEDLQPFPTLQRCFESVDLDTGFQIEVKYPQEMKDVKHEQENYFDLNEFLDLILKVVFTHHGGRRIIFSSFCCQTCTALRLKQNRYPVLFLTQGNTTIYDWYKDIRTQSAKIASDFCLSAGLQGVNVMSEILMAEQEMFEYIKDAGLLLFTWGELNNDSQTIEMLKKRGVNAVIYDRIDHFKTSGKESIFKVENNEKSRLLQKFASPSVEDVEPLSDTSTTDLSLSMLKDCTTNGVSGAPTTTNGGPTTTNGGLIYTNGGLTNGSPINTNGGMTYLKSNGAVVQNGTAGMIETDDGKSEVVKENGSGATVDTGLKRVPGLSGKLPPKSNGLISP